MNRRVGLGLRRLLPLAGWLAVSASAVAGSATTADAYPPVELSTFHLLQFADADVGILKNVYPPHSDSGFHVHSRELFYVVITPARFSAQKPGGVLRLPVTAIAAGTTGYNVMAAGTPFIHRVVNDDDRPCHVVAIELRRDKPAGTVIPDRPQAYVPIFDNPRMRAWRLTLAPGQVVPAIMTAAKGVRVVVRGGSLATMKPGVMDQIVAVEAGDVEIQPVGSSRVLRNAGITPIEIVEIELK